MCMHMDNNSKRKHATMCNLLCYLRPCLPVFTGPNNTLCAVTVCRVTLEQLYSVLLQSTKTHFKSNGSYKVL